MSRHYITGRSHRVKNTGTVKIHPKGTIQWKSYSRKSLRKFLGVRSCVIEFSVLLGYTTVSTKISTRRLDDIVVSSRAEVCDILNGHFGPWRWEDFAVSKLWSEVIKWRSATSQENGGLKFKKGRFRKCFLPFSLIKFLPLPLFVLPARDFYHFAS